MLAWQNPFEHDAHIMCSQSPYPMSSNFGVPEFWRFSAGFDPRISNFTSFRILHVGTFENCQQACLLNHRLACFFATETRWFVERIRAFLGRKSIENGKNTSVAVQSPGIKAHLSLRVQWRRLVLLFSISSVGSFRLVSILNSLILPVLRFCCGHLLKLPTRLFTSVLALQNSRTVGTSHPSSAIWKGFRALH